MRLAQIAMCLGPILAVGCGDSPARIAASDSSTSAVTEPTTTTLTTPATYNGDTDAGVPPTLPSDDFEIAGRTGTFVVNGFVVSLNETVRVCGAVLETAPPTCGFPAFIVPRSVAADVVAANLPVVKYEGLDSFQTVDSVTLLVSSPRYDSGKRLFSVDQAKLASDSDRVPTEPEVLIGQGKLENSSSKDISPELLALGFEVSSSGSVQIFGSPEGGFEVVSLLPLTENARRVLTEALDGPLVLNPFAQSV